MLVGVPDDLLTVPELAARLRVTPETIRRWLRDGKIRGHRFGGPRMGWRIARTEIARLMGAPALHGGNRDG
jgi:excisionase family DNA binding protein